MITHQKEKALNSCYHSPGNPRIDGIKSTLKMAFLIATKRMAPIVDLSVRNPIQREDQRMEILMNSTYYNQGNQR